MTGHCWHAHLWQKVAHRRDYYCCRCGEESWRPLKRGSLAGHGPYYEVEDALVSESPSGPQGCVIGDGKMKGFR